MPFVFALTAIAVARDDGRGDGRDGEHELGRRKSRRDSRIMT
jgi:hypothetical protein